MEFYIMYRNGIIVPPHPTPNQCKVEGHPIYYYTIGMVFPKDVQLDDNQFIIDHAYVDSLISQQLSLTGSCEEMHKTICEHVRELFKSKDIPLVACKCTLKPSQGENAAYMEYVYLRNRNDAFVLSCIK